jgi:cellulose biosynthesis protein BcsQ
LKVHAEQELFGRSGRGEVVTFYSYKGGTGRSMLLANVAWLLASAGQKVLIIDWDLEAPGVHRYFKPFLGEDIELRNQRGVIEWVTDYWDAFVNEPNYSVRSLIEDYADPRNYIRPLDTGKFLGDGGIDLLCAGQQDRAYSGLVADFDWTALYQKLRGEEFIREAKEILIGPGGYDWVLVDSRTGVSDTAGFCTVGLADTLVVCFTYNNQSVIGASQVARDIKNQAEKLRQSDVDTGRQSPFRVFAVPSRVDDLDPDRLERRQKHAWDKFQDLITPEVDSTKQADYWLSVQIRNQALFSYEEVLAACINRPADPQSVLGAVVSLTRLITRGKRLESAPLSDFQRKQLRDRFAELQWSEKKVGTQTAWEHFVSRLPSEEERNSFFRRCLPLFIKCYTISQKTTDSVKIGDIVRVEVLDDNLTAEEKGMAASAISLGIARRVISDSLDTGLMVADDSILQHWSALSELLIEHRDFLAIRESINLANQRWIKSGRSLGELRLFAAEPLDVAALDQRRSWFGNVETEFLRLIQETKEQIERENSEKGRLEREVASTVEQKQEIELQRDNSLERMLNTTQDITTVRTKLRLAYLWGFAGFVLLASIFGYVYSDQSKRLAAFDGQLKIVRESESKSSKRLADESSQRGKEKDNFLEQQKAFDFHAKGLLTFYQRGANSSSNRQQYDKAIDDAIGLFTSAITENKNLAIAYRSRAEARANANIRNDLAELSDLSSFLDLLPSLDGRSRLIFRALDMKAKMSVKAEAREKFLDAQLSKLAVETKSIEGTGLDRAKEILRELRSRSLDFPVPLRSAVGDIAASLDKLLEHAKAKETTYKGDAKPSAGTDVTNQITDNESTKTTP